MGEKKHVVGGISKKTLERLPVYQHYLAERNRERLSHISAPVMAEALRLNEVLVRKDLALVSKTAGKPKTGYAVKELLSDLEEFLGYHNVNQAVLVGAGALGRALLSYQGFEQYGVEIVAAFDCDEGLTGTKIAGKMVLPVEKTENLCRRMNIHIGIITVPGESAQEACDRLAAGGVKAVWNFAAVQLKAPPDILVQNENMAVSLAALSKYLYELEEKE